MIAVYASMKLQHLMTARHLMKIINILRDHSLKPARLLKLCQLKMRCIRLCSITEHLVTVKLIKFFRMTHKKRVAQNRFRRIIILLMIQTVL